MWTMINFWVKVMDSIILQILWIGYVIYQSLRPKKKIDQTIIDCHQNQDVSQTDSRNKRHFIHLYTTTSTSGKPVCFMDVYNIKSESDEQKLRSFCSKGVPNQTYFKHKEQISQEDSYIPRQWKDYSIMAV